MKWTNEISPISLGRLLTMARITQNLTIEEMSIKTGISINRILEIEKGVPPHFADPEEFHLIFSRIDDSIREKEKTKLKRYKQEHMESKSGIVIYCSMNPRPEKEKLNPGVDICKHEIMILKHNFPIPGEYIKSCVYCDKEIIEKWK